MGQGVFPTGNHHFLAQEWQSQRTDPTGEGANVLATSTHPDHPFLSSPPQNSWQLLASLLFQSSSGGISLLRTTCASTKAQIKASPWASKKPRANSGPTRQNLTFRPYLLRHSLVYFKYTDNKTQLCKQEPNAATWHTHRKHRQ